MSKKSSNFAAQIEKGMHYLFTSESVSEGHPDKVSDQISDAILDNMLAQDPGAHVACETLCTTGQVVIAGEVSCNGWVDIQQIARKTIAEIGYTKAEYKFEAESCGILTALHAQSQDINMGVSRATEEEQLRLHKQPLYCAIFVLISLSSARDS